MNIQRIAAIRGTSLERPGTGAELRTPEPGETVLLTVDELRGDAVLATTSQGISLRLTGLNVLKRDLQAGDTLALRVLANDPVLELQLYSARPDAEPPKVAPLTLSDFPAMRLDLAELRAIAWAAPSAAALAVAWQVQASERAVFPVYVWSGARRGGMQMNLALVDPDEERRRRPRAVQIELSHPSLGYIVIDVRWRLGVIQLTLAVEAAAAPAVRAALPSILAALSRANLRLVRIRLTSGRARAARARTPAPALRGFEPHEALDSRLFRAAAETAVTLLNPASPRC